MFSCMTKNDAAKLLEEYDALSCVDMIDMLRKDESRLLYAGGEGVSVEYRGLVTLASFIEDFTLILDRTGYEPDLMCVHDEEMRNHLIEKYGYENEEGCYSYSYYGTPFDLEGFDFRTLDISYKDRIREVYTLASEESLLDDFSRGEVFGLFIDSRLAGFIGFHSEGSMGMLHVFEEGRKKGYGSLLEKYDINRALELGRIPYCHVFESNAASQALQAKLALKKGKRKCWWLWKD